jgi:hypothetical protein
MTIHTYLVAQSSDHDLSSINCICQPEIESFDNGNVLVIHNLVEEC